MPRLKSVYNIDVEKVVQIMMDSKEKNWKKMGKEWLNSLELGLKIFFEDPEDPNIDYLKKCYEEYIRYCKVLKQKALTKRQIYDSVKKYIKP